MGDTIVRSIELSTQPTSDELTEALERANLSADTCGGPGLRRLRSPSGRTVYVEERVLGASGRRAWLVHADAFGADAPRQIPCATPARALIAIRAALSGSPIPPVLA